MFCERPANPALAVSSVTAREVLMRLVEKLRGYPFWFQALATSLAVTILVVVFANCGATYSPPTRLEKPRLELPNREGSVHSLAFSPTENWLASGTNKGTISLWNITSGVVIKTLDPHQ